MSRRVDGSLGTLLQGVSQQPDKERLQGQVTEMTNMTADVVRMLSRRPASEFINSFDIGTVDITKCFVHFYSRGDGEQYWIIITPGGNLYILDLDGTIANKTVTPEFTTYITSADPKADLRMTTVGDYTFVVNKTKTVAMSDDKSTDSLSRTKSGLVEILAGQYSREYRIKVVLGAVPYEVSYTTPESTDANAEALVSTENIATELAAALNADPVLPNYFDISTEGSGIRFTLTTDIIYNINVFDGSGGGAMRAVTRHTVGGVEKLPAKAKNLDIYKVEGGVGAVDDFYMRFQARGISVSDFQDGTWVETVGPDQHTTLDASTMPHVIKRTATVNTFECGAAGQGTIDAWAEREVGTEETNKDPQFVGQRISDITSMQDRLVIIDREGVNLSVTSDFFNFFKKTVTTLLADGPIGITSASGQVNILEYAEQQDKDLIIFSNGVQFTLIGTTAITPQNATLVETTKFKIQTGVRPAPSGQNLFFAVDAGAYSGVREFYTDSTFDSNNARPITVAIERYITGKIRHMASATNLSKMCCIADAPNLVYMYEYLWDENDKVQNAWGTWEFRDDMHIFYTEFFNDSLYVLGYIGTEAHIIRVPLQSDIQSSDILTDSIIASDLCMDHTTWHSNVNTTVSGLDYLPDDVTLLHAIQGEGCPNPGMIAKITDLTAGVATFAQDMQGGAVLIGVKFRSSVTPTRPYMRDNSDRPIGTSDLILNEMLINYTSSGDFNVDVTADYSYTERNSGRVLGQQSATIGEFLLTDGQFPVAIRAANDKSQIQVYSDSPYPFTVSDIEWTGQFYKRGTRTVRSGGRGRT